MTTEPHIARLDLNELAVFLALRRNDGPIEISTLAWEASVIACDELQVAWTYDNLDKIFAVILQSRFVRVETNPGEDPVCHLVPNEEEAAHP
jgi:hypothetical protein